MSTFYPSIDLCQETAARRASETERWVRRRALEREARADDQRTEAPMTARRAMLSIARSARLMLPGTVLSARTGHPASAQRPPG